MNTVVSIKPAPTEHFAVLTGDIVNSSQLALDALHNIRKCFDQAITVISEWEDGLVLGEVEFYRGDSWQLLINNPESALRVAVFIRASLFYYLSIDTRISIGLGRVSNIFPNSVSHSTGEAFNLSGHGLNTMTGYTRLTIEIPKFTGVLREWLLVVAGLSDSLINKWTRRQAETVHLAAQPDIVNQIEIANRLSVVRQTVTDILKSADWHFIREAIRQFEKTPWDSILEDERENRL